MRKTSNRPHRTDGNNSERSAKSAKKKLNIIVTSGGTIEPIDPVRYISNFSTGIMGESIALEAAAKGHKVTIIKGGAKNAPTLGCKNINALTTSDMMKAVIKETKKANCLIMAAAVCDFTPAKKQNQKIKKQDTMILTLTKTQDILKQVKGKDLYRVGFALETKDLIKNASKKVKNKKLDFIIANKKTAKNDPFGKGKKDFVFIDKKGKEDKFKGITKKQCAKRIIKKIEKESKC